VVIVRQYELHLYQYKEKRTKINSGKPGVVALIETSELLKNNKGVTTKSEVRHPMYGNNQTLCIAPSIFCVLSGSVNRTKIQKRRDDLAIVIYRVLDKTVVHTFLCLWCFGHIHLICGISRHTLTIIIVKPTSCTFYSIS
jgi:hypothetical protein